VTGRVEPGLADLPEVAAIRLGGHTVPGHHLARVLDGQLLIPDPDRGLLAREAALSVQPPVAEADAPVAVDAPCGPEAEEAVEGGRVAPGALDPAEDGGRAPARERPLAMGEMGLVVVVVEEALVRGLELGPRPSPATS
jgi:hypothetical protein